jgi:putative ABC transport system permease protein
MWLPVLAPVFWGSLARRRMASLFSLLAIVLGVALGMAVQAVHEAALSEFGRGLRTLAGAADLQAVGGRAGFDEAIYARLAQRPELQEASPVLELEVRPQDSTQTLPLLGLDVFTLARVTPALLPRALLAQTNTRFAMLDEHHVFLSVAAQTALNVQTGSRLILQAGTHNVTVTVAGDIPGAAERRMAVMDIAAVQSGFGMLGRLTRIDLHLADGVAPNEAQTALQPLLGAGVWLQAPEMAQDQAANLSRAYRVNLTLLAAIALLTGGFLVFSAQSLSVVRRRTEFAFLRALGLSRRSLFAWLLAEGALVGLAGGVLGAALGHGLAWGALALLGGDLGAGYFSGLTPRLQFQPQATLAYVGLGLLAGLAGAWLPAREAATVSPAQALKAGDEATLLGGPGHPVWGLGLLLASTAACTFPPVQGLPLGGYVAVACLLGGGVLLLPLMAGVLALVLPQRGPVALRLAGARLKSAPGHAVVAAAGVLTSVALAAAMAIMVASFRDSVDQWLGQVLPADLYLRPAQGRVTSTLDTDLPQRIAAVSGVARSDFSRFDSVRLAPGRAPVALIARPLGVDGSRLPLVGAVHRETGTAIWMSEAMQDLYGWKTGQLVEIPLAGKLVTVYVAGVWRDYARQTGSIAIDLVDYRRLSDDGLVNDAAIYLAPGARVETVASALKALAGPGVLEVAPRREIRAISLKIFDRTFAVTYVLEAVAVAIGLAGVAASFAALASARKREFGMLRHLGLTRRQIASMLALEGALAAGLGVMAGLLAGGAIGLVLIEVVNRQSFHWSMDLRVPWTSLTLFALALVTLAALAAVLAGAQAMRQDAVLAVREDW